MFSSVQLIGENTFKPRIIINRQFCMSCPDKKNTPSKDYISDTATCIATFVVKIYNLLNDPQNASAIGWDEGGKSFTIRDIALLTTQVLPHYFRHNNYQSFIRQLNMYSFTKLKDHAAHRFENPYFIREREDLLRNIRRKPERKKRRQSQDLISNQKENQLIFSQKSLPPQEKALNQQIRVQCALKRQEGQILKKKKVGFFGLGELENEESQEHISTIIQVTRKWISNNKQQSCWSNINSYKSIDISMKLIKDQEKQDYLNEPLNNHKAMTPTEAPVILLFHPNITERTIKQLQTL